MKGRPLPPGWSLVAGRLTAPARPLVVRSSSPAPAGVAPVGAEVTRAAAAMLSTAIGGNLSTAIGGNLSAADREAAQRAGATPEQWARARASVLGFARP